MQIVNWEYEPEWDAITEALAEEPLKTLHAVETEASWHAVVVGATSPEAAQAHYDEFIALHRDEEWAQGEPS